MFSSVTLAPSSFAATAKKPVPMFYVSIGDSYAAGFEVGPGSPGGFATKVVAGVAPRHKLILRNFGCGGATTTSLMSSIGCADVLDSPGNVLYPQTTQLAAALAFIHLRHGRIGLITISIGGNDLNGSADNVAPIANNISIIAARLRGAAGKSVPIIGLTYPDVVLANWLSGTGGVDIAEQSIIAFQEVINPDWKAAYASSNVTFVDVTAAFGAYIPLTQLVDYSTYGQIPTAVDRICILTGMCTNTNVHPTNAGYSLMASLIIHAYLKLAS
jgi:lysophospholipase L1-like esterase